MQTELQVSPQIYAKDFPAFGRPKIVGYIGLKNIKFCRHVSDNRVNYDLNLNISNAIHRPQNLDAKLTELLKFLLDQEKRLNISIASNLDVAHFFCYRGLMTCIACTPYENREPWKIVVILHRGNIYMCARDTEEKTNRIKNMSDREKLCTSWGYKFEQFVLSDTPDGSPNPHEPVDENEEFSLVFNTNLNKHTIFYGAEMDGVRCDIESVNAAFLEWGTEDIIKYLSSKKFIELKTNRHIEFRNQEQNFRRFKTKKWWCQSFLVGVEKIICGFRNDDGIVEQLKVMDVKELPKISKKFWNPNVCFNFLETFLTFVKRCLSREIRYKYGDEALNNIQNLPLIDLMFEWRPGMAVQVTHNYCHEDDPILPEWFLNNYRTRNNLQDLQG